MKKQKRKVLVNNQITDITILMAGLVHYVKFSFIIFFANNAKFLYKVQNFFKQ